MEIDLGPAAEKFRDELRQWLEANRPDDLDENIDPRRLMYEGGAGGQGVDREAARRRLPVRRRGRRSTAAAA